MNVSYLIWISQQTSTWSILPASCWHERKVYWRRGCNYTIWLNCAYFVVDVCTNSLVFILRTFYFMIACVPICVLFSMLLSRNVRTILILHTFFIFKSNTTTYYARPSIEMQQKKYWPELKTSLFHCTVCFGLKNVKISKMCNK